MDIYTTQLCHQDQWLHGSGGRVVRQGPIVYSMLHGTCSTDKISQEKRSIDDFGQT